MFEQKEDQMENQNQVVEEATVGSEEQVVGEVAPKVEKVKKISKLSILRDLLSEETGYTKEELAEITGLKLSTVNCQMYYHLPLKDMKVERLADKKFRFAQ